MSEAYWAFGWRDLADIALAGALFWGVLAWLRQTRALPAFLGLAFLWAVYVGARELGLVLTARLFQAFSAAFLVLVVVVFQSDLRRLLEHLGSWRPRHAPPPGRPMEGVVQTLVRTVARLTRTRTGALLVLPGREPLDRHLTGGVELRGLLSEPLLLSLFDPHSPGHDGAILVQGDRVERYAIRLPLSAEHERLKEFGTRHAAALGLAERSDALVIAVSEEKGTVSVAQGGTLRTLEHPEELTAVLYAFFEQLAPGAPSRRRLLDRARREWPFAAAACALAVVSWISVGPGGEIVEAQQSAPVLFENLPAGQELEAVNPPRVTVVVQGKRRTIEQLPPEAVRVRVDAVLARLGRRTFQISPQNVETPPGVTAVRVDPPTVKISLRQPGNAQ
ncbi:MAG: diadenylate cyclase CdaA [Deferrisomatales bacterium]